MEWQILLLAIFLFTLCGYDEANSQRQRSRRLKTKTRNKSSLSYKQYLKAHKLFRKYYHSQFNPKLVKGRCKQTPIWSINGTYPILEEVNQGNAVFLFLMKKPCARCWNELHSLHDWAKYYDEIGTNAKIIALMHRKYGGISKKANKEHFPYIKIYHEPEDKNIFGQLKARVHDILMYDQCGRHQYHYGWPYSTLVEPYVRLAMKNTLDHFKMFCGDCKPIVFPTNATNVTEGVPPTETNVVKVHGPDSKH